MRSDITTMLALRTTQKRILLQTELPLETQQRIMSRVPTPTGSAWHHSATIDIFSEGDGPKDKEIRQPHIVGVIKNQPVNSGLNTIILQ